MHISILLALCAAFAPLPASALDPAVTWSAQCEVNLNYDGTGESAFAMVLNVSNPTPYRLWEVNVSYPSGVQLTDITGSINYTSPLYFREIQPWQSFAFYGNQSPELIRVFENLSPLEAWEDNDTAYTLAIKIENLAGAPLNLTIRKHIPNSVVTYADGYLSNNTVYWNVVIPADGNWTGHMSFSRRSSSSFNPPPAHIEFNLGSSNSSLDILSTNVTAGGPAQIAVTKFYSPELALWGANGTFRNPTTMRMELLELSVMEGDANLTTLCTSIHCGPYEYLIYHPNATLGPGEGWESGMRLFDVGLLRPAIFYAAAKYNVLFNKSSSSDCEGLINEPRINIKKIEVPPTPPQPPTTEPGGETWFLYRCSGREFLIEYVPVCIGEDPEIAVVEENGNRTYIPYLDLFLRLPDNETIPITSGSNGYVRFPELNNPGHYGLEHCWNCCVRGVCDRYCISTGFKLRDCEGEAKELQLIISARLSLNKSSQISVTDTFGNQAPLVDLVIVFPSGLELRMKTDMGGIAYFTPDETGRYKITASKDPVGDTTYLSATIYALVEPPSPWCGDGTCDSPSGETHGNCPADCTCDCLVFTAVPLFYSDCGTVIGILILMSAGAGLLAYYILKKAYEDSLEGPAGAYGEGPSRRRVALATLLAFALPLAVYLGIELAKAENPACGAMGGQHCWDSACLALNAALAELLVLGGLRIAQGVRGRFKRKPLAADGQYGGQWAGQDARPGRQAPKPKTEDPKSLAWRPPPRVDKSRGFL